MPDPAALSPITPIRRTYAAFDPQLWVLFVGSLINAVGFSMVLIPTGAALVADLAPAHLRGRYMGAQGLATGIGFGIGKLADVEAYLDEPQRT